VNCILPPADKVFGDKQESPSLLVCPSVHFSFKPHSSLIDVSIPMKLYAVVVFIWLRSWVRWEKLLVPRWFDSQF